MSRDLLARALRPLLPEPIRFTRWLAAAGGSRVIARIPPDAELLRLLDESIE
ncbi:MAG: hypothetical protein ACREJ3_19030 [Polyangiaceae bacterium]